MEKLLRVFCTESMRTKEVEEVKEVREVASGERSGVADEKGRREKARVGKERDTHPPGVFWKYVWGKELAEGVCETCVDKGLTGLRREANEVGQLSEAEEIKERGVSAFMTWPQREKAWGASGQKMAAREEPQRGVAPAYSTKITTIDGRLSRK
jgi:hypothetical protein